MNMKISYTNRRKIDVPYTFYHDVSKMAADVDFLVITAAGGEATRKAVNSAVLAALATDHVTAVQYSRYGYGYGYGYGSRSSRYGCGRSYSRYGYGRRC